MFRETLLSAVLLVSVASAAERGLAAAPGSSRTSKGRALEFKRRTLNITDANLESTHEVRVAPGISTALQFPSNLRADRPYLLPDVNNDFDGDPIVVGNSLILTPRPRAKQVSPKPLTVNLVDGTALTFKVVPARDEVDTQVEIVLELQKRATPESPVALKSLIEQLRGQLDECRASSGERGIVNMAEFILRQDHGETFQAPQSRIFEGRQVRFLDKQQRLLVQVRAAYRLFGVTYLLMTVENRDPGDKSWVLDRVEVSAASGGSSARVFSPATELSALPSGAEEKVVLTFETPVQGRNQGLDVTLFEKGGDRHVTLKGLEL